MSQKLLSFLKVASKKSYDLVPKSCLTKDLCDAHLCYLGEQHHSKTILQYQLQVLNTFTECQKQQTHASKIAIVFEMFNMNQQHLLNRYHSSTDSSFSLKELQIEYDKTGIEGFDIENHYGELLQFARDNAYLFDVFGGFPPRTMAKVFLKTDIKEQSLWKQIFDLLNVDDFTNTNEQKNNNELKHVLKNMIITGNEKHYQYFYYLLSDKVIPLDEIKRDKETELFDKYGNTFVAQCFKDTVMAYNVMKLWMGNKYDKIIIIGGHGHFDGGYGVKERIETLLQFQNIDLSEIKQVIISTQIEKEIKDTPFFDTVSDYILFI